MEGLDNHQGPIVRKTGTLATALLCRQPGTRILSFRLTTERTYHKRTSIVTNSPILVHPLWLRVTHWVNAVAIVVMVLSGWQIYNASPLFGFRFPPEITLGSWLGGGILWHFAAMWLLVVNGLIYLGANVWSRRLTRQFLPISPREVLHELGQALRLRLHHQDLRVYNAVQRLAYLFVWFDVALLVVSGLVLWKSVQFSTLRVLLGGYETARIVHFSAMTALVAFTAVHLVMVAVVPRSLLVMLHGVRSNP
jgi:thiosulfate reductase cytochrome b subunit